MRENHEDYMRRCLELAKKGAWYVPPNPVVGAVITHNGQIIGEGYHAKYGEAHAEVNAISAVEDKSLLSHSRLYVSLEPCSHIGKTPPCTDLIIKHAIPEVITGMPDLNTEVSGGGHALLRDAGIKVLTGLLLNEGYELNRRFVVNQLHKRPYIILKWAETADGFIARADFSSKWISCDKSRELVHLWRAEESAILVGTNTAYYDNPKLTARIAGAQNPVRVVIDNQLRLPDSLNLFDQSEKTIIFNSRRSETGAELEYIKVPFERNLIELILEALFQRELSSLLVEGGSRMIQSFIDLDLWDEARVFTAQKQFGEGVEAPKLGLAPDQVKQVEGDKLKIYKRSEHYAPPS